MKCMGKLTSSTTPPTLAPADSEAFFVYLSLAFDGFMIIYYNVFLLEVIKERQSPGECEHAIIIIAK